MSGRNKLFLSSGIVVLLVAAVMLSTAARRDRAVQVRLEPVKRRSLVATVTASGQIVPKTAVDISADITGRIVAIPVKEGQEVKQGQLLLRIDPSRYEAGVAQAKATLSSAEASALQARANRDQAKRALDRAQQLRQTDTKLISDEQLEQAQTADQVAEAVANSAGHQVDQARAALNQAEDDLSKTVLRAPLDGEVTRVAVEVGEVAVPSTFSKDVGLLMTVSDLSVIIVKVQVDETDVVRLQLGDSADVSIDAFPDTTFAGRVTKISQSAILAASAAASQSSSSGSQQAVDYDVEVTLDHPPPDIRPDLSATAKVITATRDSALSIPIIALTTRQHTPISTETAPVDTTKAKKEAEGVFVVHQGLAQFRPVGVGIAGEEYFEVLKGLQPGDTIVAGPYQTVRDLKDSTRVRALPGAPKGKTP
jgi:HlyD family secretion protein